MFGEQNIPPPFQKSWNDKPWRAPPWFFFGDTTFRDDGVIITAEYGPTAGALPALNTCYLAWGGSY